MLCKPTVFNALALYVILFAVSLLATPSLQAAEESSPALIVSDAYFRLAPPGRSMTAAYMQLKNNSGQPQVLTAFHSSSAASIELHNHIHVNGMMKMRKVDTLSIDDGETVQLQPGGYHLMIFGLQTGLSLDDSIAIELQLESGQSVIVNASARSLKQKQKQKNMHKGHH